MFVTILRPSICGSLLFSLTACRFETAISGTRMNCDHLSFIRTASKLDTPIGSSLLRMDNQLSTLSSLGNRLAEIPFPHLYLLGLSIVFGCAVLCTGVCVCSRYIGTKLTRRYPLFYRRLTFKRRGHPLFMISLLLIVVLNVTLVLRGGSGKAHQSAGRLAVANLLLLTACWSLQSSVFVFLGGTQSQCLALRWIFALTTAVETAVHCSNKWKTAGPHDITSFIIVCIVPFSAILESLPTHRRNWMIWLSVAVRYSLVVSLVSLTLLHIPTDLKPIAYGSFGAIMFGALLLPFTNLIYRNTSRGQFGVKLNSFTMKSGYTTFAIKAPRQWSPKPGQYIYLNHWQERLWPARVDLQRDGTVDIEFLVPSDSKFSTLHHLKGRLLLRGPYGGEECVKRDTSSMIFCGDGLELAQQLGHLQLLVQRQRLEKLDTSTIRVLWSLNNNEIEAICSLVNRLLMDQGDRGKGVRPILQLLSITVLTGCSY